MTSEKFRFPVWIKIGFLAALLIIIGCGIIFFQLQKRTMYRQAEENLASIAWLKANQIANWRRTRLKDGANVTTQPYLARQLTQWLANPQGQDREPLLAALSIIREQENYINILLMDTTGDVRLSLPGPLEIPERIAPELSSAFEDHQPIMTELHVDDQFREPHLSVVAPLFAGSTPARPIGAVILMIDPTRFLYPLIQSWPVLSDSAETLLVRRDGDDVLFLNTLRYKTDAALKLRIPLTRIDLPAAMAIEGKQGLATGNDYRGVKVLSYLLPIPDSTWFMVTKMDVEELFAPWRFQAILILALFVSTLGIFVVIGLLTRQHAQKSHLFSLYRSEAKLRAVTERHSITLKSISDAVIVTNAQGQVEFLNSAAQKLTGWTLAEAAGKPVVDVYVTVDEHTRTAGENPIGQVLRTQRIVERSEHAILLRKGGGEIFIDDNGAPVRDDQGSFLGAVLVFRDISEHKQAARDLQESESFHRQALESIPGMVFTTLPDGYCDYQSQQWVDYTGVPMSEHLDNGWNKLLHPEDRPRAFTAWRMAVEGRAPYDLEYRVRRHDGVFEWFKVIGHPIKDNQGRTVRWFGVAMNIGELKRTEQALREAKDEAQRRAMEAEERERVLTAMMEHIPIGITIADAPDVTIRMISRFGRELIGRSKEEIESIPMDEFVEKWDIYHADGVTRATNEELPLTRATQKGEIVHNEVWVLGHSDGNRIPILCTAAPIRDKHNRITGGVIGWQDITESRRIQTALEKSEKQFRALTTASSEVLYHMSPDWSEMRQLHGRGFLADTIEPSRDWLQQYIYRDDQPYVTAAINAAIRDKRSFELEHRVQRMDGTMGYTHSRAVPLMDRNGDIVEWFGAANDITERKRAEIAIKNSLAEKEVLLKEIHHRVKNNMQVISSLVALQESETKEPAVRDILQEVTHRVRSMALVHEKLYQSADLAQIDFADYAKSLLNYLWRAHETASGIRLEQDLQAVMLPINIAIPCGLILNELVGNALKHAFKGREGGKVTVSLNVHEKGRVDLSVRDNGTGLPPGSEWRTATSLGLRLVQMLSGQIHADVEVADNEGTEFTITFEISET